MTKNFRSDHILRSRLEHFVANQKKLETCLKEADREELICEMGLVCIQHPRPITLTPDSLMQIFKDRKIHKLYCVMLAEILGFAELDSKYAKNWKVSIKCIVSFIIFL